MSARIDGLRELQERLKKVVAIERAKAVREVKRSALNVVNGAKRRVPVDTGRLRNSITHEIIEQGLDARIGTNVVYGRRIEFGFSDTDKLGRTYNQSAKPYLFPALEEERAAFLNRLRKLEAPR